ncbi:MAG TPA: DUF4058 family protein [Pirellulales bacterium]|nr:DUF4058 family protein [Pirellulales bacterium]
MPLRDHFRSPLDDVHSWDELHGLWPATIVRALVEVLPEPYYAAPGVHLGTLYEIDVGTYGDVAPQASDPGRGGVAAAYAPPKPTRTAEARLPKQDLYEVRIYDGRRKRRLVAAIEIVSPSNKDRPERRGAFLMKVAALLEHDVCVSIVDVVTTSDFNLYSELLNFIESDDAALGDRPPPIYAATVRMREEAHCGLIDEWYHPLAIGQALPILPLWLTPTWAISLDLETTYEETCRILRIR